MSIRIENSRFTYTIGDDARNQSFVDQASGVNYAIEGQPCAFVRYGDDEYPAVRASESGEIITLEFAGHGAKANLHTENRDDYTIIAVESLEGADVDELVYVNIPLTVDPDLSAPFCSCLIARDLRTRVQDLPSPSNHLQASCFSRFGFVSTSAAIVAAPPDDLRSMEQQAVTDAPELIQSPIGGPWALDAPINRGSYLFNTNDLSVETVDEWIALAGSLGINQIDFHGGDSFRFGDCHPNPKYYPDGFASLKAVIDRLHHAGISAGLHTYSFFIDKKCPWVTPVPDPRLASDTSFTLSSPVSADSDTIPVNESTAEMSAVTGFFVRNSNTLRIGEELVTYDSVQVDPPAFTGCTRGAHDTTPSAHAPGDPADHLKECFGLFVPDPDTTLLGEVAQKAADAFNTCGFDMTYMDALDGEDVFAGREWGWHYGSRYVFEFFRRLEKPALFEASTFHHHLWCVRSRSGAWDHPTRGHRQFIDLHCEGNRVSDGMFLPAHLGWWSFKTWNGVEVEPTFVEDIEYLCTKALAHDVGISIMGVTPDNADTPLNQRLGAITRRHEELRRSGAVSAKVRGELARPVSDFRLVTDADGEPVFHRMTHDRHRFESVDPDSSTWIVNNPFGDQPVSLRIEALPSTDDWDSPDAVVIPEAVDPDAFTERDSAPNIEMVVTSSDGPDRQPACTFTVRNESTEPDGWAMAGIKFDPALDLGDHEALSLWVHGDGSGALLSVQLHCPTHIIAGLGNHIIPLDFTGWRHVNLIEIDAETVNQCTWPFSGDHYGIYREGTAYDQIAALQVWCGGIAPGSSVSFAVSGLRALPLRETPLRNPAIDINGSRITFATTLGTGEYLELTADRECIHYDRDGAPKESVVITGDHPDLIGGDNRVSFASDDTPDSSTRGRVTLHVQGPTIG
jgi:hypothetical protein